LICALALVPLIGAMGGALDYSRASNARAQLQAAVDAGVLAAAQSVKADGAGGPNEELNAKLTEQVRPYVQASGLEKDIADSITLKVERTATGVAATAGAEVPTSLLAMLNIRTLPVSVHAEVTQSSAPIEVALTLDVTGSMRNDMGDLRAAAQSMVDILTARGAAPNVKLALVPFVGAVNIGNDAAHSAWLDDKGDAKHHAEVLEKIDIAMRLQPDCSYETGNEPNAGSGSTSDGASLWPPLEGLASALAELVGVTPASAQDYSAEEYGPCYFVNPAKINHKVLFAQMPNASWKGCVEARAEPYDVSDTPPNPSHPDTLWVPYFWPDGVSPGPDPDVKATVNNYISDEPYVPGTDMITSGWGRALSAQKYNGKTADIDEIPPTTRGPNRACPDPIVPLTTDYALLSSRIAALSHYEDSGTNAADGVAWGWRVLSPGAPFTEGAAYGENPKILVLLSDGKNELLEDKDSPFVSHYSAYGFVYRGRFATPTFAGAEAYIDDRMSLACSNAKAAGIEIYVVAFGVDSAASRSRLQSCATDSSHVLTVDRTGDLVGAFQTIASKISRLRLSR
jgi:Flp pilus assembly protein TadG